MDKRLKPCPFCKSKQKALEAYKTQSSGWIPVAEKPMPLNEVVLIFMRNFSGKPECAIRYFAGTKECLDGFTFTSEIRSVSDVTHWQPLPEPPKKGTS